MHSASNVTNKNKRPKLSVIMAVFNGEQFLVESIQSILDQSYSDFEFIIINDGSTDSSLKIINSFNDPRIIFHQNIQNIGLIASLNKGIKLAKSSIIARHDCDDIALPERFYKQMLALEDENIVCVGCNLELIDSVGNVVGQWRYPEQHDYIAWKLLFNNALPHPGAIYRKEIAVDVGCYDPVAEYAEDYDLWSKFLTKGELRNIQESLVKYRIHEGSISKTKADSQRKTRAYVANNVYNILFKNPTKSYPLPPSSISEKSIVSYFKELSCMADMYSSATSVPKNWLFKEVIGIVINYSRNLPIKTKLKLIIKLPSVFFNSKHIRNLFR